MDDTILEAAENYSAPRWTLRARRAVRGGYIPFVLCAPPSGWPLPPSGWPPAAAPGAELPVPDVCAELERAIAAATTKALIAKLCIKRFSMSFLPEMD